MGGDTFGGSGDAVRELRVSRHAAERGAPVVPPSSLLDAGPHEHAGFTLVFCEYLEHDGAPDPVRAGEGLRTLHDALADFEGELPPASRTERVHEMLAVLETSDDIELLRALATRPLPRGQALHGDSGLYNCLATAQGPIWHDLETTCRGPREYDLAALALRNRCYGDHPAGERALAAYGAHDEGLFERALVSYAVWIAASWVRVGDPAQVEGELRFLRTHHG
jgi:Ser/Thr protein kinase RdoA (MazF antagonist)